MSDKKQFVTSRNPLKKLKRYYNPRKLSLGTRLEIRRKKCLIRQAKILVKEGMRTPTPASITDSHESTISLGELEYILESCSGTDDDYADSSDYTENVDAEDDAEDDVSRESSIEMEDEKMEEVRLLVDEEAELIEE
jgi:hypothetical protein